MRKAMLLILLGIMSLPGRAETSCRHVGGTISTNFIDPTTTFGTATGDLSGGVGVSVSSVTGNPNGTLVFRNQHHWVTTTGDTINVESADATAFPTLIGGFYAVSYTQGLVVSGGTGRFQNATGKLSGWGAVNTSTKEIVLRYEGSVCFADPEKQ
jgi:hypothetical protein